MQRMLRAALTGGIRGIDWVLRYAYRVRPLSDDPDCILRVSPGKASCSLRLSDGTSVRPGDPLANIHLWNERLLRLGGDNAPVAWGVTTFHHFRASLLQLARRLRDDTDLRHVVAVCGHLSFVTDLDKARRLFTALGFDLVLVDRPGLRIWRPAFWDNLFASWLMWAFNPASLHGKKLANLVRAHIWISREQLLRGYLGAERPDREL